MKSIRRQLYKWLQDNKELVQNEAPVTAIRWFVRDTKLEKQYTYALLKPVLDSMVTYTEEGTIRNVNR